MKEQVLDRREAEACEVGRSFRPDGAHHLHRSGECGEGGLHGTGGGSVVRPGRRGADRLAERRQERVRPPERGSVRFGRLVLQRREDLGELGERCGGGAAASGAGARQPRRERVQR